MRRREKRVRGGATGAAGGHDLRVTEAVIEAGRSRSINRLPL